MCLSIATGSPQSAFSAWLLGPPSSSYVIFERMSTQGTCFPEAGGDVWELVVAA